MRHNSTNRSIIAAGGKPRLTVSTPKRANPGWIPIAGSLSSLLVIAVASLWAVFAEKGGRVAPTEQLDANKPVVAAGPQLTTVKTTQPPVATKPPKPTATPVKAMSAEDLFAYASPSIAKLDIKTKSGGKVDGTGFFISSGGLLVTNHHVIENMASMTAKTKDGRTIALDRNRVIGIDKANDLALLQVRERNFKSLTVASAEPPKIGAKVHALGFPLGLNLTLSEGLVSAYHMDGAVLKHIQTTAAISPGSSGGPILNSRGQVIGVAMGIYADPKRLAQNINMLVPAAKLLKLMRRVRKPTASPQPNTARRTTRTIRVIRQ